MSRIGSAALLAQWGAAAARGWRRATAARHFHLLPSQELSLLSEHIPRIVPAQIARSGREAASLVAQLPGQEATLTADISDPQPHSARFVPPAAAPKAGPDGQLFLGVQGAVHTAKGKQMAQAIADKMLAPGTRLRSSAPPYALKRAGAVIVSRAHADTSAKSALRLQVLLLADRKGHPHPQRTGMHYGPTLTLSRLPDSIFAARERLSLLELTSVTCSRTCIDVGRLRPMGTLEQAADEEGGAAAQALRDTAAQAGADAVAKLEADLALPLGEEHRSALREFLQDLFALYWRADGERFALAVQLDSSGRVHILEQSLSFDDYTTGKAGRQKLLTALRAHPRVLYKKGMAVPAERTAADAADNTSAVLHDLSALEAEAEAEGLVYRTHQQGNIALFGYGAGMGMGTLDGVIAEGGRPSNFLDGGGGATRENARAAVRVISKDPTVKALLVNIFGGITKSDQVALGIIDAFEEFGLKQSGLPLVARFKGNKAKEAQENLANGGLPNVQLVNSLREAAQAAIAAASAFEQKEAGQARRQSLSAGRGARGFHTLARRTGVRGFATSAVGAAAQPYQFVTGYAFAGKPREPEQASAGADDQAERQQRAEELASETTGGDAAARAALAQQIGFSPDTHIGRWRDQLLQGGQAGEDALACADMGRAADAPVGDEDGDVVLAVADGVGGWTENGVDPSLFSQALMYHVTQRATQYRACPDRLTHEELDPSRPSPGSAGGQHPGLPQALLSYAYDAVQEEPLVIAGSATACVLTLDASKGVLRSANLGDSGFIVLRKGWNAATSNGNTTRTKEQPEKQRNQPRTSRSAPRPQEDVYFASTPLQFGFNTPYQLAKLPASMRQEGSISNKPSDAALWDCQLRDGDIVLAGTDGLWDNVHIAEIVQLMRFIRDKHQAAWHARGQGAGSASKLGAHANGPLDDPLAEERSFVQLFAHNLVEYTKMCQFSQTKRSPFEREAERYGIHYPGGKIDDVAVVLALATER